MALGFIVATLCNFLQYIGIVLGEEILSGVNTKRTSPDKPAIPQLEIKTPFVLAGSYDLQVTPFGANLPEAPLTSDIILFDEDEDLSELKDKIVLLRQVDFNIEKLHKVATMNPRAIVGIQTDEITLLQSGEPVNVPAITIKGDIFAKIQAALEEKFIDTKESDDDIGETSAAELLVALGYTKADATTALEKSSGNINQAAVYLFENCKLAKDQEKEKKARRTSKNKR